MGYLFGLLDALDVPEASHVIFAAARRLIQRPQRERGLLLRL